MSPDFARSVARHQTGLLTGRATLSVACLTLLLAACAPLGSGTSPATTAGAGSAAATAGTSASAAGGGGTTQLTIATGGTSGVYYPLGGGFAQVIRENVPGHDATVQETNASVDNMQLIGNGGADLALVLGDTAADAVEGRAQFEGAPVEACTLGNLYNNSTQVVTSSDSGIETIEDMRGKRVSLGATGSGTEVIALRILEAAGIDPDADIERQQLAVDETVNGLRDGTLDAGFWSGGLPTGGLTEYATTGDLVLIPTGEYTDALVEAHGPFYLEEDIPAGTYEGQDEAVPTIIVPNVLVASPSMDEELQRQITAAIFDHKEELVAVHAAAEALDPATAGDVEFMDVCPGARAYFDEQG
jgi:TRAP transporter TAXI family solute receptor